MNQQETAGLNMSLRRILLILAAGLTVWASGAAAQEKLGDIMREEGLNWMVGKWMAKTDEGQKIQLTYRWSIKKYLVTVDLKMGDYAYHGMIFFVPTEEKIVEIGVDNRGATSKVTWDIEGDKTVSKGERIQADGKVVRAAIFHSKTDAETMKIEIYGLSSSDELAEKPWSTLQYRKQSPKKADNKTAQKAKYESLSIGKFNVEIESKTPKPAGK